MYRSRRTRYRATVSPAGSNEIRKIDALVYGGVEDARALLEARGFTVLEIGRPDAAKRATGKRNYTISVEALREAIEFLGLRYEVKLRYNGRVGPTNGNYRFAFGYHDIMLKSYLSVEDASRGLWHELAHAMQCERELNAGRSWNDHVRAQNRWSYSNRPIEVEARTYEEYHTVISLAVAS